MEINGSSERILSKFLISRRACVPTNRAIFAQALQAPLEKRLARVERMSSVLVPQRTKGHFSHLLFPSLFLHFPDRLFARFRSPQEGNFHLYGYIYIYPFHRLSSATPSALLPFKPLNQTSHAIIRTGRSFRIDRNGNVLGLPRN